MRGLGPTYILLIDLDLILLALCPSTCVGGKQLSTNTSCSRNLRINLNMNHNFIEKIIYKSLIISQNI